MGGDGLSTGLPRRCGSLCLTLYGSRGKQLVVVRILLECVHNGINRTLAIRDSRNITLLNFLPLIQLLIDQVGKNRLFMTPFGATALEAFDTGASSAPWEDRTLDSGVGTIW